MPKFVIGQQVFYNLTKEESEKNNNSKVAAAIITQVWSETCVNLKAITDGSENLWKTSVMEGTSEGRFTTVLPIAYGTTSDPVPQSNGTGG